MKNVLHIFSNEKVILLFLIFISICFIKKPKLSINHLSFNLTTNTFFLIQDKSYFQQLFHTDYYPLTFYTNFSECPHCDFSPKLASNYFIEDVIIATAFGRLIGIYPTITSLRTSGVRAPLFLIVDINLYNKIEKSKHKTLLSKCRLFPITFGKYDEGKTWCFWRIYYQCAFFSYFSNHFDRCMFFDIYDSIFQNDPFNYYDPSCIIGYLQPTTYVQNPYDFVWLDLSLSKRDKHYLDKLSLTLLPLPVVNVGFKMGPIRMMIKYHHLIIQYFIKNNFKGLEQSLDAFLYHTGIFEQNQIYLKFYHPYGPFIASESPHQNLGEIKITTEDGLNEIEYFPTLIHHTYLNPVLKKSILLKCPPPDDFDLGQYFKK